MKCLRRIVVIMIIFVIVLPCMGGWVISEQIVDNFGNSAFQTTFIQQNQIRFENASSISILDLNHQSITIVFPNLRAFWQGSPSELTVAMIEAYDSQAKAMVLGLPYDQQEEFRLMYDSIKMKMLHPDTTRVLQGIGLIRMDSVMDLNGFSARKYIVEKDSLTTENIWITTDVKPYNEMDAGLFVEMSNQINAYSRRGFMLNTEEYLDLLSNGLILKSVKLGQGGYFVETMVVEVKEIHIPADFFLPPKNYRKVSIADAFTLPIIEPGLDGED